MTRRVAAVVGVPGVGKTSLLKNVGTQLPFLHLQASELIKDEIVRRTSQTWMSEQLRSRDIRDNQKLLLESFLRATSTSSGLIVLDGHAMVDTPNGLVAISPTVFSRMGVSYLIAVYDDARRIADRRSSDTSKSRPYKGVSEIEDQQKRYLNVVVSTAVHIHCPMVMVPIRQEAEIVRTLKKVATPAINNDTATLDAGGQK